MPQDILNEVPRVINCAGTRTQLGGARMREKTIDAMRKASKQHVYMTELQAHASHVIANITSAEAGMVTSGGAAGLTLAAAACIAGNRYDIMQRLPDTTGIASEILIPKAHRFKYDVAFRVAGADLIDVGHVSHHPVDGGSDRVEPWQIRDQITEDTVAVAYVARPHNRTTLSMVVDVAHEHGLPVIVDAAGELPPRNNLSSFFDVGADLVSFSGGKAIRGPQSTGILAGRRELIQSAAVQHLSDGYSSRTWNPPLDFIDTDRFPEAPPCGIGRMMKVSKEDVAGLIHALGCFVEEDEGEYYDQLRKRADSFARKTSDVAGLDVRTEGQKKKKAIVKVEDEIFGASALDVVMGLREGDPRIWVGERRLHKNEFSVSFECVRSKDIDEVVDRLRSFK